MPVLKSKHIPWLFVVFVCVACERNAKSPNFDSGSLADLPTQDSGASHMKDRGTLDVTSDQPVLNPVVTEVCPNPDMMDVRTVFDFSIEPNVVTCSNYELYESLFELPFDPAAYPVAIDLPATTTDPSCEPICGDGMTQFGFTVGGMTHLLRDQGWAPQIYVPEPWHFVSGGCGEACPWPCLGGYQEFVPGNNFPQRDFIQCITINYGDFGFATEAPSTEPTRVVIGLVPFNDWPSESEDSAVVQRGGSIDRLENGETSVFWNDSDGDGDTFRVSEFAQPVNGEVTVEPNGEFVFTHDGSEGTREIFVYTICDDDPYYSLCSTSRVVVSVVD